MNARLRSHAQSGFSLVELMVALVLGIILTSGVISVYITSKNTYKANNALGSVQEHGRFAFTFIDPKIRMAGYTGCSNVKGGGTNNLAAPLNTDAAYNMTGGVYGFEYVGTGVGGSITLSAADESTPAGDPTLWSPSLSTSSKLYAAIQGDILKGSDAFMVESMQNIPPAPALVGVYDDTAASNLYVSTNDNGVNDTSYFQAGTIAVVNNCSSHLNIFQITAVDAAAGTLTYNALGYDFSVDGSGTNVGALSTYAYYVGKGIDGSPSLFQAYLDNTGAIVNQELVSGIENMQVVYGVDKNGDKVPDNFQTADTIQTAGLWTSVVSVRVALLARSNEDSTDQIATNAPVYYMLASDPAGDSNSDGMTLTLPMDRHLRKYFVQTFSLRNSLP